MIHSETAAQRYAQALLAIAVDHKKEHEFLRNAEDFSKILAESRELLIALSHPNISRKERKAIIDAVLSKTGYDAIFQNFLRLLADRSRIAIFPAICDAYSKMMDDATGRQRGKVYAAQALSFNQRETLKNTLRNQLNCDVILTEIVDPELIGGLRVEIAGHVYDNTLRHHLDKIREGIKIS